MNLDLILRSLDLSGHFGQIISTEESIVLHNSLLVLQNENHFKQVFFWGKIFGAEKDYYIAYGYEWDILTGKIFYYSNNCMDWGRLPKPTETGLSLSHICFSIFQGKCTNTPTNKTFVALRNEDEIVEYVENADSFHSVM